MKRAAEIRGGVGVASERAGCVSERKREREKGASVKRRR
jgi:hypothetical protein